MKMPPWFEQFLRAVFYVPCPAHKENRKWCNLYCTDCMTPVCSDCRDDADSHCRRRKHLILQVVRSSYQAAVQIDGTNGVGKLFGDEEDDIQVYRANRVRIYYLHSRGPSKADAGRASPFLCRACNWPLLDPDKRYCSISCKLMPEEEHGRLRRHLRDSSFSHAVGFDGDDVPRDHPKGDKRKAKCPRRSPMF